MKKEYICLGRASRLISHLNIMGLYDEKGSSCHCKQPQPTLHPCQCPRYGLQWEGFLKSSNSSQPFSQNASNAWLPSEHYHSRKTSRVWVTSLTVQYLHSQCESIWTTVLTNVTYFLWLEMSTTAHLYVSLPGHQHPLPSSDKRSKRMRTFCDSSSWHTE